MDSDDEEFDDPGQGELAAVGDDEDLETGTMKMKGKPPECPRTSRPPQQNK